MGIRVVFDPPGTTSPVQPICSPVGARPRKEPLYDAESLDNFPEAGSYEWFKWKARRICVLPGDPPECGAVTLFKGFTAFSGDYPSPEKGIAGKAFGSLRRSA